MARESKGQLPTGPAVGVSEPAETTATPPPSPPPGAIGAALQQEAAERAAAAQAAARAQDAAQVADHLRTPAQAAPDKARKKGKVDTSPLGILGQIQRRLNRLPSDKARAAVVALLTECYPTPAKDQ